MENKLSKKADSRFALLFNNLLRSKRSQTVIIGAVLLILIVVAIAVILMSFIIPFVNKQLAGTSCFDVVSQVSFRDSNLYTCYYDRTDGLGDDEMRLQVHVGDVKESIGGFDIALESSGSSRTFQIRDEGIIGMDQDMIKMYGFQVDGVTSLTDADPLNLPGRNEDRTYVIELVDNVKPDFARLFPILSDGSTCNEADVLSQIGDC